MNQLPLCNLCKSRPANKENSHIVSKLFGKSMLTQPGGKRKGFSTKLNSQSTELKGKPLQDIHKEDHILCTQCEKFLADELENEFARQLYNKLKTVSPQPIPHAPLFLYSNMKVGSLDIMKRLFYSIAWRADLVPDEYPESKLTPTIKELLRQRVEGTLSSDNFTTTIFYAYQTPPEENVIYIQQNADKSIMFLNDLLVIISFSNDPSNYFSIETAAGDSECKVIFLDDHSWKVILKKQLTEAFQWLLDRQ